MLGSLLWIVQEYIEMCVDPLRVKGQWQWSPFRHVSGLGESGNQTHDIVFISPTHNPPNHLSWA